LQQTASQLASQVLAGAMPIKDAIDVVEFLVELTRKYSRYTREAATADGLVEIATIELKRQVPINVIGRRFMDGNIKIRRFSLNIYSRLVQTVLKSLSGKESPVKEKHEKNADGFVTVTPSGAVSVDLGGFIRTEAGQKQVGKIRKLQDFTRSANASSERKKAQA